MQGDRPLSGRHAVITGGGTGIGAAIATALAWRGAALTLLGRDLERVASKAERLRGEHGIEAHGIACDVTDEAAVHAAFADAASRLGAAQILVNNAGQAEGAPVLETSLDLWNRMLAVNLTGAFLCARAVLPAMLERRSGRIINIASTSALRGYRNVSAYCSAKHGVVGLTRALAAETVRAGITVNAVCPAYTDTEMSERAVATVVRDFGRTEDEARSAIVRTIPRGTLIRPEEVASAVAWLCSDSASGVTGQAIAVAAGEV